MKTLGWAMVALGIVFVGLVLFAAVTAPLDDIEPTPMIEGRP